MNDKIRACYNCLYYEDRGTNALPIGSRSALTVAGCDEVPANDFAPRCLKGLNPSLAHAPKQLVARSAGQFEPDSMAAFCDDYLWAPPWTGDKFRNSVLNRSSKDPRFTTVRLAGKFARFWDKGVQTRLKVLQHDTSTVFGFVSMSQGYEPVFLLVPSTKAKYSRVVLSDRDRIVGIRDWHDKGYRVYRDIS